MNKNEMLATHTKGGSERAELVYDDIIRALQNSLVRNETEGVVFTFKSPHLEIPPEYIPLIARFESEGYYVKVGSYDESHSYRAYMAVSCNPHKSNDSPENTLDGAIMIFLLIIVVIVAIAMIVAVL